ncbi:MAG: type VI secretion system tip protein TssI/VgrG, partial [Planctomycetota bacterium]
AKQASAEGDAQWTRYHYPGEFTETDRGQALAKLRQQSWDAAAVDVRFEGNPRRVRAGNVFELSEHPESEHNVEYLVTETRTSASLAAAQAGLDSEFSFAVEIAGQPSKVPFRSALSASSTSILGPHVAVVTGKADEEIWTDKYGRIKVQFPWDPDGGNDENSSCWVRVAQPWTGKTWGAMSLPRIGEEVIVQFVDGNPDRPIVVGRLNNADMMPPDALGEAQSKTV